MNAFRSAACAWLLVCVPFPLHAAKLRVVEGTTADGRATELWQTMIATLRSADVPQSTRLVTAAERAWIRLVESRSAAWQDDIPLLARNFDGIDAPAEVRIVVGNREGEDAFVHDATTIGFDVSRLSALYGDATTAENGERMNRFFRHEYTHLLQNAWLKAHPYAASTPLRAALLALWKEGLGHYYSLSDRWRTAEGAASDRARQRLAELEPRFVARLSALACASPTAADALMAGLSIGAFDDKWGALPVALWLQEERRRSEDALREFVAGGPDGIWLLAERHLSKDATAVLREARRTASVCPASGVGAVRDAIGQRRAGSAGAAR